MTNSKFQSAMKCKLQTVDEALVDALDHAVADFEKMANPQQE